jgi:hypothetical protein
MEWMLFGWAAFAVIIGIAAGNRGRSAIGWALLAALISPLLALALLLALGSPVPNANTHKKCPACAEWCANEAQICKHCGTRFAPAHNTDQPAPRTSVGDFRG